MTKKFVTAALLVLASLVTSSNAGAQTSRWGDGAIDASGGSFELGFEKRIMKSDMYEPDCPACTHYLEIRVGQADVDEIDVTHFILGYRNYLYVNEDVWAAYLGAGVGRYNLDPGETHDGRSLRLGVDIALTKSCSKKKNGQLRSVILDWETNITRHWVDRPGAQLTYTHVLTGLRFILPSKHDRERVAAQGELCPVKG